MPDVDVTSEPNTDLEVAKLLMQEYLSARQEVILHVQLYKTQGKNAVIITTLAGISLSLVVGPHVSLLGINLTITPIIALIVLYMISIIVFLMMYLAIDILFALQVLAERCVRLENKMNSCLRGPYFVWEQVATCIWSTRAYLIPIQPDFISAILL